MECFKVAVPFRSEGNAETSLLLQETSQPGLEEWVMESINFTLYHPSEKVNSGV